MKTWRPLLGGSQRNERRFAHSGRNMGIGEKQVARHELRGSRHRTGRKAGHLPGHRGRLDQVDDGGLSAVCGSGWEQECNDSFSVDGREHQRGRGVCEQV